MFEIVEKRLLAPNIWWMDVLAPRVARSCQPGQFVIIRLDVKGERIPLTICDYDRERGTVSIVFQTLGASTRRMAEYQVGDHFNDFVGPLGQASELVSEELVSEELEALQSKNILFVAGGVGAAPVYPQVKWLSDRGIPVDVIMGTRSVETLILKEEMQNTAANVFVATDDGSAGTKGLVTHVLQELVQKQGRHYDLVVAIGPIIMMKFVAALTKELGIPTIVSMNPIMVDGTGMCGACRVSVGGEVKFACVDGPEFDGHLVNFDEAMRRQTMYKSEEGRKLLRHEEGTTHHRHGCGCEAQGS